MIHKLEDFKIGDRVVRVRDTTGYHYGDYIGREGIIVDFGKNIYGKPLVYVNYGDSQPRFCLYPNELEFVPEQEAPGDKSANE